MADPFNVLLVESQSQGLQNLVDTLSYKNLKITTAATGGDALQHLFREDFDLIILSVNLPHMDGFSLVTKIRNRERSRITPILLLSSGGEEESMVTKAYSVGKVDHVYKPVSPALLKAKVNMWVKLSKELRSEENPDQAIEEEPNPTSETTLYNQEARFRQAIEGAQDSAVLWLNEKGQIVSSNSVVQRMLGYTKQELKGKPISLVFSPEDIEAGVPEAEMRKAVEQEQGEDERWHVRKDGSRFWAVGLMTPLWKRPGELEGYIKILRDRTDQKLAFDLAQDTEKRYKQLLDSTAEGIFGIDVNGRCTFANASCLSLLGYPDEPAILGKSFHDISLHSRSNGTPCREQECSKLSEIREGEVSQGDDTFQKSDGSRIPVKYRLHAIRSNDAVIGAVITFLDVSERKRAEARYQAVERHYRQAQRLESIGRLAGGLAHELNNDLTAVIGHCDLILDALEDNSPIRPSMEEIFQGGKRAAELVRKLLVFAGKQLFISQPIRLDAFLKERYDHFRGVSGDKVDLSMELAADLPEIYSDPEQLEQVILGILANAKEAISEEDNLILSARRVDLSNPWEAETVFVQPGIYACLSIRDTGRGIPEEIQERIFEPFFSTKPMGKSTVGMGLSSAYGFIKQCGGTINIESEPARGAAIDIYLPTVPNPKTF